MSRPKVQGTQIYSVFGQLEAAAAEFLITNGKATRVEVANFPPGAPLVNEAGQPVRFGLVVPREHVAEFDEVIAGLRA